MRVDLDAEVQSRDGRVLGRLRRAIVSPEANTVTDVVVSTGAVLGRDIVVPRAELDRATDEGNALRLDLSQEELERLPDYIPANYTPPPQSWVMPAGFGVPVGGYLWPVGYGDAVESPAGTAAEGERPSQVSIPKGAVVLDRDGDDLGVVEDVRFDPESGRLRGFVLRVGGALRTLFGGGETVEITSDRVARIEEGVLHLRVTKQEVERAARPRA